MRPQLDPQKLAKLSTANDLLTEKYGAENEPRRAEFDAESRTWYDAEMLEFGNHANSMDTVIDELYGTVGSAERKEFRKEAYSYCVLPKLVWITKAEYVDGYRIALTFNDGLHKIIDLSQHLDGEIFEPLKKIEFFKRFRLSYYTIEWENGANFAPEFLHSL